MAQLILILLVFAFTLLLTGGVAYFLSGGSGERQKILTRLTALQEAETRHDQSAVQVLKTDFRDEIPFSERIVSSLPGVPQLALLLEQAAIEMAVESFVLITLGIFAIVVLGLLVAGLALPLALVAGIGAAAIPTVVAWVRRQKRFARFEELFPDAIDQLARAVRAGHAFTTGFDLIGQELPDPVGREFRITYSQQNLGVPLSVALSNLATRVPLPDVRFFVAAIQIQRESGGNLGEVLDSLSYVVRERFKLLRQIRVFTAEGRMSMHVLTAIPLVGGLAVYLMNPEYMTPLFTERQGQMALLVAAISQIVGYIVIRRLINIKV